MNRDVSEEMLNAFADDELAGTEKAELLERLAAEPALRAKVCEAWHLKELVRSAHPLPAGGMMPLRRGHWRWLMLPVAACLLLLVGAGSGWLAHEEYDERWLPTAELRNIRNHGGRVVLHLVSGEPQDVARALRVAEQLASARDAGGAVLRVELIANGGGIRMLQAGNGAVAARLTDMARSHDNLRLLACNEALNRLRERGVAIEVLPEAEVVPSAVEEIASRLNQGWRYVQI